MLRGDVTITTMSTEFFGHHYVQVSRCSVKIWGNGSICPRIFWTPLVLYARKVNLNCISLLWAIRFFGLPLTKSKPGNRVFSKNWRPKWNAAKRGISSASTMFIKIKIDTFSFPLIMISWASTFKECFTHVRWPPIILTLPNIDCKTKLLTPYHSRCMIQIHYYPCAWILRWSLEYA